MAKYDAVGIKIGVDFEEYSTVKTKLDVLLKKIKDSQRTIDLKIDIKDVDKQLKELEKTLESLGKASKVIGDNISKASKDIKEANRLMEKNAKAVERANKQGNKKGSGGGSAQPKDSVAFGSEDSLKAYVSKVNNELANMLNLKLDDKMLREIYKLEDALKGLTTGTSKEALQNFKNKLGDMKTEAKGVDATTKSVEKLQAELRELEALNLPVPQDLVAVKNSLDNQIGSFLNGRSSEQEIKEATRALGNYREALRQNNAEAIKELETRDKITAEIESARKALMANIDRTKTGKAGQFLDAGQVNEYERAVRNLNANSMDELRRNVRDLNTQWGGIANSAQRMASNSSFFGTLSNAMRSMAGYYLSGQVISKTTQAVAHGVRTIIELDSALVDLKKVSTETDEVLNGFVGTANKMAIDLGHSTTAVMSSVTDYIKVGKSFKEAQELAQATIIYSNVGDMEINSATEAMISTLQAFNNEGLRAIDVVDKLNEVANNYAVSAEGLGEALKRSASSLNVAGNTLDQSLALIAGANTVVQNAPKVGNALKTISMRLRGVKEDTGELIPSLRETFMLLTNNKVDIMLDEDTFKSTYQIMTELGAVWDGLTDKQRAYLAELSAGKTQANVFVSIMENIKGIEDAYETSMNSQGSAMREQERYMESLMAKVNALKESVVAFWNSLVDTGVVAGVLDGLTGMVNLATKLVDTLGSLPAILGAIGVGVGVFKGGMVRGAGSGFLRSFGQARSAIGDIRQEMMFLSGTGRSTTRNLITSMGQVTGATGVATTATKALGTALASVGTGLAIGFAIQLVVKLITHITEARERMEEAMETAKSNISGLNDDIATLEELSGAYEELGASMGSLSGFQAETTDKQKEYLAISERLLEIAPELSVAFTDEGQAIVLAGQNLDVLIQKKKDLIKVENEILALNSRKLLEDDSKNYDSKFKKLERAKQEVEKYQMLLDRMKLNGFTEIIDENGYTVSFEQLEKELQSSQLEMKNLQAEVMRLDSSMAEYANNILRVSDKYNELTPSGQQAVQMLVDLDSSLLQSDDALNQVITTMGGFMEQFDGFDFSEANFDVKAFQDLQVEMIEFLRTMGLTEAQIFSLSQNLMNQYKQAWMETNKEIAGGVDFLGAYNEQLKGLGTQVLDHADKIISLKEALKELDENNGLSAQTLRGLVNEYPALITAIGDEEAQRRILMDAVVDQEALQEAVIENILEMEKQAHIQKVSLDEAWYENKKTVILAVVEQAGWGMSQELEQAKSLAKAKMQIDNEYAKQHKALMQKLYGASMGNRSLVKLNDTVNGDKIKEIDKKLETAVLPSEKQMLQSLKKSLQDADRQTREQLNAMNTAYDEIMQGFDDVVLKELDLSSIGDIKTGLSSTVNKPSSNKNDKKDKNQREEKEKIFTYDGAELDEYANNLQKIIEKIDDYDNAIDEAYKKKERLHDKKMYEEELSLIDELAKKEEERAQSYNNRIKDIENNNASIVEVFRNQEGIDLSVWSEAELEEVFNSKYGDKKDFKTEADKEAWEKKAKNFQNYVRAYYDGVEAIEDLNDKLSDSFDALEQLKIDKFEIQIEIDDRKLKDSADALENIGRELEIIQTMGGDNLNKQVELMAQIAGAETYKRQELERQINLLQQQLALLDATDATYQSIVDRLEELQDAQYDSYINELRYRNQIKQALLEQLELELEKSIYGGEQQDWEDANDAKINALKEQLELMKKQTDEKKEQEEREKRLLEIQKLKDKLENLKRQKTVQQLKQNADGSWEWEYVADQEAISDLEQEIKDKEKAEEEKEAEEEQRKKEEEIQKEIDRLQEEARIRREAFQRMLNDLKKYFDKQENIFEISGSDIEGIVEGTLDALDKVYNGKFSNIIDSMRDKVGELSDIFEEAKDEAEDWYEDAIKPPTSTNKPKPEKPETEKPSTGGSKPDTPKLTLKEAKIKAQANEQKYLHQEMKKAIAQNLTGYQKQIRQTRPKWGLNPQSGGIDKLGYIEDAEWNKVKHRYGFYTGGETQGTGLHWLDGSLNKPERVLSAEQTQAFNKMVEIMPDFLTKMQLFSNIAPNMSSLIQGMMAGGGIGTPSPTGATPISGTGGQTVIVENIELPNVTDADAFRKEMAQFLNGSFSGLSQSAKVQKSK